MDTPVDKGNQDNLVEDGRGQGDCESFKADAELEVDTEVEGRQVSKEDYPRKEWSSVVYHYCKINNTFLLNG